MVVSSYSRSWQSHLLSATIENDFISKNYAITIFLFKFAYSHANPNDINVLFAMILITRAFIM